MSYPYFTLFILISMRLAPFILTSTRLASCLHAHVIVPAADEIPNTPRQTVISSRPATKWLLDHGMDPNLPADRGSSGIRGYMTPMNAAAQQGACTEAAIETMEMLLGYGATLDQPILETAIRWRQGARHERAVLQWLVDQGADVNCPMRTGATLLHAAVYKKNLALLTFLLENGANVSAKDSQTGKTALVEAQEMGLDEFSECLKKHQDR